MKNPPKYKVTFSSDILAMSLILVLLVLILGGALLALVFKAGDIEFISILQSSYIQRVLQFTLYQAVLSTGLSILIGLPLARFFFYHRFKGRDFLLGLFGLCLVMPTIVVILGLVQVHGKSGFILTLLSQYEVTPKSYLYGLTGILLAHIFYNAPLVTRALLSKLDSIPSEQWRLACQLNFTPWQRFKLIELPALLSALPGLIALIMMLCFTSFAVILTLGGGPKSTSLEVAIYQALHFDFDLARAVALSALQLSICAALTFILLKFGRNKDTVLSLNEESGCPTILQKVGILKKPALSWIYLGLIAIFILPPLVAIVFEGLQHFDMVYLLKPSLHQAALTSLIVAASAGAISIMIAACLCAGIRHLKNPNVASLIETGGSLILVFPPFALASGLFIILYKYGTVDQIGPFLVVLINGLMALPFALRIMLPAFKQRHRETDHLCQNLGISGWNRFTRIDVPLLKGPIALAFAYAVTLSIGDFGVIALFGSQDFSTLPLYIYRAMGAYRMGEAAFSAMCLMAFCYVLFTYIEEGVIRLKSKTKNKRPTHV